MLTEFPDLKPGDRIVYTGDASYFKGDSIVEKGGLGTIVDDVPTVLPGEVTVIWDAIPKTKYFCRRSNFDLLVTEKTGTLVYADLVDSEGEGRKDVTFRLSPNELILLQTIISDYVEAKHDEMEMATTDYLSALHMHQSLTEPRNNYGCSGLTFTKEENFDSE